jgi:hypothetical protein
VWSTRQREDWRRREESSWRQRQNDFRRRDRERDNWWRDRLRRAQSQRRHNYWRFQQRYWERLQRDRVRRQSFVYVNVGSPSYQYYRGNQYYYVNQYGAELLQRAINAGYEEGYWAGQADREDGWGFDYESSDAYLDATLGYDGYYVDLNEYQYYFREGFRRGYEDGYYGRSQYGRYSDGKYSILGNILNVILNLTGF